MWVNDLSLPWRCVLSEFFWYCTCHMRDDLLDLLVQSFFKIVICDLDSPWTQKAIVTAPIP